MQQAVELSPLNYIQIYRMQQVFSSLLVLRLQQMVLGLMFIQPPVPITIGTTYYLVLSKDTNGSQCVAGDTAGGYANGQLYANAGYNPFPNFDYTFHTYSCGGGSFLYNPGALSGAIRSSFAPTPPTYTVTATSANGCTATSTILISQNNTGSCSTKSYSTGFSFQRFVEQVLHS